jgi:CRISPR-associated protein Csm2
MANDVSISGQSLRQIIGEGNAQELVIQAEKLGSALGQKRNGQYNLTTNQIRAIFGTVRQVQMSWDSSPQADRQLVLLKPKLRYRAARDRSKGLNLLADVLSESIDLVLAEPKDDKAADKKTRFGYFVDFFEAILAYHKVAGGK